MDQHKCSRATPGHKTVIGDHCNKVLCNVFTTQAFPLGILYFANFSLLIYRLTEYEVNSLTPEVRTCTPVRVSVNPLIALRGIAGKA
jgi:hypothetical protein